jgi:DNA-binding beta-propeller fold protein YncE
MNKEPEMIARNVTMGKWPALGGLLVLLLAATAAQAQEKKEDSQDPPLPVYPQVTTSTCYQVDPQWPHRPEGFVWEAVPGIAVDREDRIYVFTRSNPPIQVYSADGKLIRAWGEDVIDMAHHLKIDADGNVWISDIGLHVIRKCNPQGEVLLTIGTPGEAGCDQTHLYKPTDMAIAPNGHVFVSDGYGNNRVVHFDEQGKYVNEWGQLGTGPRDFSLPHAIAIDADGQLYVADRNNARVCVYNQQGELLDLWKNLIVPWGFCVTRDNEIWVCGSSPMPWQQHPDYPDAPLSCPPKDQILMKFRPDGRLLQLWTIPKGTDGKEQPGDVNWIHAVAVDSKGNLYVGDIIGKRAQKFARQE